MTNSEIITTTEQLSLELPPGVKLGNYTIIRTLGQGGFGVTYLARDIKNNCEVVIKENLPAALACRDNTSFMVSATGNSNDAATYAWALDRFLEEARTLARLHHDNIVRVACAFRALGTAYYVMPWVGGKELGKGAPPPAEIDEQWLRPILGKLLDALSYLHSNSLLHRDIKPSNILLNDAGDNPVLIDFGTARSMLSERSATMIESAGYTPIEQLQAKGQKGPWCDVYALGATCYTLLTGERPPRSLDRMGREDTYRPLEPRTELHSRFSPEFLATIDRAMALWPDDRWQTTQEWQLALNSSKTPEPEEESVEVESISLTEEEPLPPTFHLPTGICPPPPPGGDDDDPPPPPPASGGKKLNKTAVAIAAGLSALIVAALGIAYWFLGNRGQADAAGRYDIPAEESTTPDEQTTTEQTPETNTPQPENDTPEPTAEPEPQPEPQPDEAEAERQARQKAVERANRFITSFLEAQRHHAWPKSWHISHLADELSLHKDIGEGLKILAEDGNTNAMYVLSCTYKDGLGCPKNEAEGLRLLQQAAEENHRHAQHALGYCYEKGLGRTANAQQAVSWYRRAHDGGHTPATYSLANCYRNGEGIGMNLNEAHSLLRRAAEAGNPRALYTLGLFYFRGIGCNEDPRRAFEYMVKAAEKGCPLAMAETASCYLTGMGGVPKNTARAQSWFRNAMPELVLGAESGEEEYQLTLGVMYQNALGCSKNEEKAFRCFKAAADQGNTKALWYVANCHEDGIGTAKNDNKAFECYKTAAERDHAEAQFKVGLFYQDGRGGAEKDATQAVYWYSKAADNGSAKAQINLGVCYENGEGVDKDPDQAFAWYSRAAEQNHSQALVNLGLCYVNGVGVTRDNNKAYESFRRSADLGNTDGMRMLALCYENGVGTTRNTNRAIEWYQKAARKGNKQAQERLTALGKSW